MVEGGPAERGEPYELVPGAGELEAIPEPNREGDFPELGEEPRNRTGTRHQFRPQVKSIIRAMARRQTRQNSFFGLSIMRQWIMDRYRPFEA